MQNTFRTKILEIAQDADLNRRERVKLRLVLRFRPELLSEEIFAQAQAEGVIPVTAKLDDDSTTAIDFAALAEFIKEVLPAILQIISLFL